MAPRETRIPFMQSLIGKVWDLTKTNTRRPKGLQKINAEPDAWTLLGTGCGIFTFARKDEPTETVLVKCPYGGPGDILLPTETWATPIGYDHIKPRDLLPLMYGCDPQKFLFYRARPEPTWVPGKWRPPMFMPKWASRGRLEILSVRAERVQEITEEDAKAEGVEPIPDWSCNDPHTGEYRRGFMKVWHDMHGFQSDLMWVWRLEFRRVT